MSIGENLGCQVSEKTGNEGEFNFLAQPTGFAIDNAGSTTLSVSWTAPNQGYATEYHVKDATGILGTVAFGATSLTITGLTPSTPYTLWVVTSDGTNESIDSNTDAAPTADAGPGWTLNSNFESGTVPDILTGIGDDMTNWQGPAIYTNEINDPGSVRQGSQAARMNAVATQDAWGMRKSFPSNLTTGDEIWCRAYRKYPAGFNWAHPGAPGVKSFAIGNQGGQRAWMLTTGSVAVPDFLYTNPDTGNSWTVNSSGGLVCSSVELDTTNFGPYWVSQIGQSNPLSGSNPVADTWDHIEEYILVGPAGTGIFRVWQNGVLIFEDTVTRTLKDGDPFTHLFVHGFWNGTVPVTQHAYCDEVVMTTVTPSKVDVFGNAMIGPIGW